MTRFTYRTMITVTVDMADEGEDFEGEPVHWASKVEQEKSAREYAEQAMPLHETYGEDFVRVDAPRLTLGVIEWGIKP
jgi:hypothetical protein